MNTKSIFIRIGQYVTTAVIIVSLILIFTAAKEDRKIWYWVMLFSAIIVEAAFIAITTRNNEKSVEKKIGDSMTRFFFIGIAGVIVILMIAGIWGAYALQDTAFRAVALIVVILWTCVFLAYFMWAVYFYNINLGLTQEEWERINDAKRKKANGEYYSEDDINVEPKYNPYRDETFGLPPGTVRGMIAFTLLFGSISLLLMSIGMKDCLECQQSFRDQFEFFKTAFLMMIAFYFGSRSLEYLMPKTPGAPPATAGMTPPITGIPVTDPSGGTLAPVINPMNPDLTTPQTGTQDPSKDKPATPANAGSTDEDVVEFFDPMAKKP
jgi:hypothetical protein